MTTKAETLETLVPIPDGITCETINNAMEAMALRGRVVGAVHAELWPADQPRPEPIPADMPLVRFTAEVIPHHSVETGYDMGGRSCAEAAAMFPQHTKGQPQ